MKITKRQLRQIIKEETAKALNEARPHGQSKLSKAHKARTDRENKEREAERNAAKDKDSKKPVSEIEMSSLDDWSGQGNQDGAVALSNSGHGSPNTSDPIDVALRELGASEHDLADGGLADAIYNLINDWLGGEDLA